ncbi:MAG TPA: universal stress protein, partial [Ilumatobacteraceae bacterium]|nr:universal stress protein [Ilumatobacteraceae bacterium]
SLDTPGVVAQARALQGPASSALLDAAANASVVVVGARGHAKLPGSLLGSVSDQVVHHATCPVVVVP